MRKVLLLTLALCAPLAVRAQSAPGRGANDTELRRVTLYGPLTRAGDSGRAGFDFEAGAYGRGRDADISFGLQIFDGEPDWLQVSLAPGARTAVRDLGRHDWSDSYAVPSVKPLPALKPDERRTVVMVGPGGGKPAAPESIAVDKDPFLPPGAREPSSPGAEVRTELPSLPPSPAYRRSRKINPPVFVKALAGHMYALRVLEGGRDFYVLFRVESVERGDNCTISWKRVASPPEK